MTEQLLLDVPQQLSPRLAWMRDHGVTTRKLPDEWSNSECPETGEWISTWQATEEDSKGWYGGDTEDEAIVALAKAKGLKLWNECA